MFHLGFLTIQISAQKGKQKIKSLTSLSTKFLNSDSLCFQAWVYFYPTVDQQKMCDSCGDQGMNGDLVIVYDVNRDNGLGHIKVNPGLLATQTV